MPLGAFKLNAISRALAAAAPVSFVNATGGQETLYRYNTADTKWYKQHNFTTTGSSNLVVTAPGPVNYAMVGGGGAGQSISSGAYIGSGGGGGGQVQQGTFTTTATTYAVVVGTGGSPSTGTPTAAGSTSAFGITALGGSTGATISASNTGASGANSGNSNAGGTGLVTTNTGAAGGGGGGDGGVGVNASTVNNAGAGGAPTAISTVSLFSTRPLLGSGGGGGVWSAAQFPGVSGATAAGGTGYGGQGSGGSTAGVAAAANTGGGGGGTGRAATSGSALGGFGASGAVFVNYPLENPFTLTFITSSTSSTSSITIPATAQIGDLAFVFDHAWNSSTTPPTQVGYQASSWLALTSFSQTINPANRISVQRKILVSGDPGTAITGMTGTGMRKTMLIYRPSYPINTVFQGTPAVSASSASITARTMPLQSVFPSLYFGVYCTTTSNISTRGSSITATREISNTGLQYIKTFEFNTSNPSSFTVGALADGGSNVLGAYSFSVR
jgi:hypothetical protein